MTDSAMQTTVTVTSKSLTLSDLKAAIEAAEVYKPPLYVVSPAAYERMVERDS